MQKVDHPKYGSCYELTEQQDIGFSQIAQGATVNETILPSGTKTPAETLVIREKYLVKE
jgi:hypothetical protein